MRALAVKTNIRTQKDVTLATFFSFLLGFAQKYLTSSMIFQREFAVKILALAFLPTFFADLFGFQRF